MTTNKEEKQPKSKPKVLPKDVAEKYTMKMIRPGKYNFHGYGTIDLRTISLKKADEIVGKGFPFLVAKKKKEDSPAK